MTEPSTSVPSTKPYLIRALFEWCEDHGFTPYLAVMVDHTVQVPSEYVNNGEIVLNISTDATSGLQLGNDWIEFKARFAGVPREISVPVGKVIAIYARENGQGMSFPVYDLPKAGDALSDDHDPPALSLASTDHAQFSPPEEPGPGPDKPGKRPSLKLVK
jgi:stringent starvation protein B